MGKNEYSLDELAQLRMTECQGTLIGGMQVAKGVGLEPEEYGYRMMAVQKVDWKRIAGDLPAIARIFRRHYQLTYGFGERLSVTLDGGTLQFEMPSITEAVAEQLAHWGATVVDYQAIQRGFWRAIEQHAGASVSLAFEMHRHVVTVQ